MTVTEYKGLELRQAGGSGGADMLIENCGTLFPKLPINCISVPTNSDTWPSLV